MAAAVNLLFQTPRARLRRLAGRLPGVHLESPLLGRHVMVTGASSGIGRATALAVATRGGIPIVVARRKDELLTLKEEVETRGGTCHAYPCDLTDGEAVDRLVEDVLSDLGRVDYLVNNAGRSIRRSLSLSTGRMHDFERTMAVNYFAAVRLTVGLLPAMRAQRFGHVVNVLSWGVQVKAPKFTAYLASKTALDVFSRIAGRETYGDNVTFTNMRLPLVRTEMSAPTDVYRRSRALTAEQAAAKVVRALEDRPITVNTVVGDVSELLNLALPRLSDAVSYHASRRYPDSAAARSGR